MLCRLQLREVNIFVVATYVFIVFVKHWRTVFSQNDRVLSNNYLLIVNSQEQG